MTEETNPPTTDAPRGSDSLRLTILESITDAFFALDRAWRFTYLNRQAERLLRRGREELLGRSVWDEFPEAFGTAFYEQYRRAADEQVSVTFDEFYPPLGRWFEVRAYPSPEGLSVYFHDVTERRESERRLRESEERYRTLFNSIDEGFCVAEVMFDGGGRAADYRFLEINPSFEKLTGIPSDAALSGRTVRELTPNLEESWFETYGRVALTGEPERFVSGSEAMGRWFDVYAFRVGGADSRKVAILFTNITERVRAEREREEMLGREQAARRRAEEANRLKDEFLATVSHELRTPLTAITGWAHMLEKGAHDEGTLRHALAVIRRNAEQQRQIVEDILDVSRIVTGKLRLESERVELATVVRAALDTVGPAAEARGVRLRSTFDHGAAVLGDPARLQQVVWNLLSNAVKFTPAGGEVRLEVSRLPAHVIVEVGDTGHGIAAEFLPHVFDRFRQADGSTTRRHGGLGLGLSIVRHLVEAHGGSVHASSEGVGRGATFTIELPPAPEGDAAARQAGAPLFGEPRAGGGTPRPSVPGGEARRAAAGLRVLLVDDDEDTLEVLSTFLRRAGAEVATASSAGEALAALGRTRHDVIVADIGMPEVDGYELLRRVRSLDEGLGGRTPAVALTAYAGEGDRDRALRVGFQEHMAKPAEPDELLRVIERLAAAEGS
ncbi:MAG TPA: ATP-binding protein [Pyrinomonadaceae bacterium]|jgi:PAS domain S-box-containing protein